MANQTFQTPASTEENGTLLDPGIKKVWNDQFKQIDAQMPKVVKVGMMTTAYEDESSYTGLSDIPEVGELEQYTEDAVGHTYNTRYTAAKFGRKMPVSYELFDDQLSQVVGQNSSLAKAMTRTTEKGAASMYINGFNTSYTSFGDNRPLFSILHDRIDGQGYMVNASDTGLTFGDDNLETMILLMRNTVDDRGNMIDLIPTKLLLPPALEQEGLRVTKSEKRSGTTDNDANVYSMSEYYGGSLNTIVWPYLSAAAGGSDTAFFILSNDHEISWKWRKKPYIVKLPDAVGSDNDSWVWKCGYRAAKGWSNPRGAAGSKGDGQVYSS